MKDTKTGLKQNDNIFTNSNNNLNNTKMKNFQLFKKIVWAILLGYLWSIGWEGLIVGFVLFILFTNNNCA